MVKLHLSLKKNKNIENKCGSDTWHKQPYFIYILLILPCKYNSVENNTQKINNIHIRVCLEYFLLLFFTSGLFNNFRSLPSLIHYIEIDIEFQEDIHSCDMCFVDFLKHERT